MDVIGIVAMSLDGYITKHEEEGTAFTSAADKEFFRKTLLAFDSYIFGAKTFLAAKAAILVHLKGDRLRIVMTRSPETYAGYQHPDKLEFSNHSSKEILTDLQQRGKTRCAVLGGSDVYTLFLAADMLDELWVTIEPRIFGAGKRLVNGSMDIPLRLKEFQALSEDTILLKYSIIHQPWSGT